MTTGGPFRSGTDIASDAAQFKELVDARGAALTTSPSAGGLMDVDLLLRGRDSAAGADGATTLARAPSGLSPKSAVPLRPTVGRASFFNLSGFLRRVFSGVSTTAAGESESGGATATGTRTRRLSLLPGAFVRASSDDLCRGRESYDDRLKLTFRRCASGPAVAAGVAAPSRDNRRGPRGGPAAAAGPMALLGAGRLAAAGNPRLVTPTRAIENAADEIATDGLIMTRAEREFIDGVSRRRPSMASTASVAFSSGPPQPQSQVERRLQRGPVGRLYRRPREKRAEPGDVEDWLA